MAVLLKPILPPTRSGRTFFIATAVLGVGAFLQLVLLAWCFTHGLPSRQPPLLVAASPPPPVLVVSTPAPTMVVATTPTPALVMTVPTPVPAARPPAAVPSPTEMPAATGADIPQEGPQLATEIARPTPAPVPRFQGNPTNLLEYARALRQRGDTSSALARLREALATEPNNPELIAETALTFEAMQLPDRAFEQWQRVYDMGESIGALYYMADSKLHNAPGAPGATSTGLTNAAPTPNNGTGRDNNGFQDNAVLKITDLHTEELKDEPAAEKKMALRIVVKARPGTVIDPHKVKIETYFYDLLDGKDIVLTDAETSYKWLTEPVDWANDASEVLETTYMRLLVDPAASSPVATLAAPTPLPSNPVPGSRGRHRRGARSVVELPPPSLPAPTEPAPTHVRTYLGYSVRLYYDGQLQDVQADPIRLLQKFPPPLTLPVE